GVQENLRVSLARIDFVESPSCLNAETCADQFVSTINVSAGILVPGLLKKVAQFLKHHRVIKVDKRVLTVESVRKFFLNSKDVKRDLWALREKNQSTLYSRRFSVFRLNGVQDFQRLR